MFKAGDKVVIKKDSFESIRLFCLMEFKTKIKKEDIFTVGSVSSNGAFLRIVELGNEGWFTTRFNPVISLTKEDVL